MTLGSLAMEGGEGLGRSRDLDSVKRSRGRPKGSLNKPKDDAKDPSRKKSKSAESEQEQPSDSKTAPKRQASGIYPGRVRTGPNIITLTPEQLREKQRRLLDAARARMQSKSVSTPPTVTLPRFFLEEKTTHSMQERKEAIKFVMQNKSSALRVLCLDSQVSSRAIVTKHFKKLALLVHPDKNSEQNSEATEAFAILRQAFDTVNRQVALK